MTICKDEKKHIIVNEYENKLGTKVSRSESRCPTGESGSLENQYICHVCGKEYDFDHIHKIEIKGKIMNICKNCANTLNILT